jgi:hypothetical protein
VKRTVVRIVLLLVGTAAAPAGQVDAQPENLSQALGEGRVTASDLRGREVFDLEEVPLGTLFGVSPETRQQRDRDARVELDPALGLGGGCFAAPLQQFREAPERRLLLSMTLQEVQMSPRENC